MPIKTHCPNCCKEYRVKDELAGRKFRCKDCQGVVAVPKPASPSPPRKDPWDDLDLDAYGDNPYVDEPIEAQRPKRKKKKSRKRRRTSDGMPGVVTTAVVCESILILFRCFGLVGLLLTLNCCGLMVSLFGIAFSGVALAGYVNANNVIRWISVGLSAF